MAPGEQFPPSSGPGRPSGAERKPFGRARPSASPLPPASPASLAPRAQLPEFPAGNEDSGASWPPLWQSVLSRTRPAPLVWTYAELGNDLVRQSSRERSELLRNLISRLRLPRGSSAFWPVWLPCESPDRNVTVPSGDSLAPPSVAEAEPDARPPDLFPMNGSHLFFQRGLRFLQARLVIFFGSRALDLSALPVPLSMPFTQRIHNGLLFVLLPDFAQLFAVASQIDATRVFLRNALSFVPGLMPG